MCALFRHPFGAGRVQNMAIFGSKSKDFCTLFTKWVRSALDRCINVVLTTKKVTKEVKKIGENGHIMAIFGP